MKTTILALASVGAVLLGSAATADAAGRDDTWSEGWRQSVTNGQRQPSQAPVTEGRNAASNPQVQVQGVEPYIARQIESNSRSR
jgi:hypothetical protein